MGAATVTAGVAAVAGIAKAASGAKQKRDSKRAARRFRRTELKNAQGSRRISTLGADVAREEAARATSTSIDALSSGGIRGAMGGAARVVEANNTLNNRVGASLDAQRVQLDKEIAADDIRIRQTKEQRDLQELSSIQQQVNAGNEQMWSGFGDVASAVGGYASSQTGSPYGQGASQSIPQVSQAVPPQQTQAVNPFAVTNPVFTTPLINPVTGNPYGV